MLVPKVKKKMFVKKYNKCRTIIMENNIHLCKVDKNRKNKGLHCSYINNTVTHGTIQAY